MDKEDHRTEAILEVWVTEAMEEEALLSPTEILDPLLEEEVLLHQDKVLEILMQDQTLDLLLVDPHSIHPEVLEEAIAHSGEALQEVPTEQVLQEAALAVANLL